MIGGPDVHDAGREGSPELALPRLNWRMEIARDISGPPLRTACTKLLTETVKQRFYPALGSIGSSHATSPSSSRSHFALMCETPCSCSALSSIETRKSARLDRIRDVPFTSRNWLRIGKLGDCWRSQADRLGPGEQGNRARRVGPPVDTCTPLRSKPLRINRSDRGLRNSAFCPTETGFFH
jgi:hypothetical protein